MSRFDAHHDPVSGEPVLVDIEVLPDPYVVYKTVRDDSGTIVDFAFVAVNTVAVAEFGLTRGQPLPIGDPRFPSCDDR